MERFDELPLSVQARITGGVYLAYFVIAIGGELLLQQAGVSAISPNTGSASTVASNVLAHEGWLQAGVAAGLISTALYVVVTTLFYQLFKSVGHTIALLGLAFGLIAMAITAIGALFELAPMAVLNSGGGATLALVVLKIGEQLGPIGLMFSGLFQISFGYLMFRSGYLPRILGALLALAGVGWLLFLVPPLAQRLQSGLEVLGFLAEVALMLWLLVRGAGHRQPASALAPRT